MKKSTLLLVSGIPASGKTTVAERISKELNCPIFIADRLKEIISEKISGREDPVLFDKVARASYDILYYAVEEVLKTGTTCVAEAFFLASAAEPQIERLKKKYNCKLIQIYLRCDFEVATKRYSDRLERGERHQCHAIDMPKNIDGERTNQSRLKCCDYTIEVDTTNFKNVNYEEILSKIKDYIL
ncbi:MAG TPA: AAA family ATPase [Candidatus Moranbacteria bacterium]|nr:AAA family ATPase [Candidatus Moranbacteria bacterium]